MKHTCPHTDRKIFSKGRCKSCATADYAKISRQRAIDKAKVQAKKYIPKESPQRQVLNTVYRMMAPALRKSHPHCEGNLPGCAKKATEIHHPYGRRGVLLIMSRHFKYLCSNCHNHCTEDSKEAKEMGLSCQINSDPPYIFTKQESDLIEKYNIIVKKPFLVV